MFKTFSQAVAARYNTMGEGELFVTDVTDIFASYLAAFPNGTNPIFRERTEHDCNCCKQFIRKLGILVTINADGSVNTVWDDADTLPAPYNTVAARLRDLVRQAPIVSVFRSKEKQYGTDHNYDTATGQLWNHFSGVVGKKHFSTQPDTLRGERGAIFQVANRGLMELNQADIDTVLDLIEAKALYRGEEHVKAIKSFRELHKAFLAAPDKNRFVWANLDHPAARFRNTVIGTLLVDLADGKDLEAAVKMFESKVAPANYKRPKALITPKMIDDAVATLNTLGLEGAVQRRMARIEDVSVNDVLFVDNSVRGQMREGIAGLLDTAVKPKQVDIKHAKDISMDQFLADILPTAKSLDLLVKNTMMGNFVTLTAPIQPDTGKLFKWNNDFAWSYDGEVADSMRQRVVAAGGRVDGVLRFTHSWNDVGRNASLMDLHVFLPGWTSAARTINHDSYGTGPRVGWNKRTDSASGGVQDVDYTYAAPVGYVPVENITFPSMSRLREGKYIFKIHNWALREPTTSGFKAEIEANGQIYSYDYPNRMGQKEWVTVAEATLKDGVFTFDHKLPTATTSRKKWGVDTETLVPVDTLMASPNYWDGAGDVGNRHWFFMLKGCKNPEEVRGIYNEFLRGDLDKHRKVFEVLGSKTKCPSTDSQLSGVGFSSTRSDEVIVVVNGGQAFNIKF